jgi:hypothetical protein
MADSYDRYQTARKQFSDAVQQGIDRRAARKAAEDKAKHEAALRAQEAALQARRDKQLHLYDMVGTAQRGNISANAAAQGHGYNLQRDALQEKGVLKRDKLQNQFTSQRDQELARIQAQEDARRFGYSTKENEQQFGQQWQRDNLQQQHTLERDRLQQGNTLQRDELQFGYDTRRQDQQQDHTLERDYTQSQIQGQRDNRLNMFDTLRDQRQQGYTQENMYQREAADISARWQEQVQQARNAGLDFSQRQQQEMKELDASFRKNVINGDYPESLKQQAMVEHQKKLAAIVPEERVQHPQEGLNQSVMFHEPTGTWFMMGRDSRGNPTYEPLGSQSGQGDDKQAAQQAAEIRDAKFARDKEFMKLVRERQMETDADGVLVYPDREAAIKAAMDEFAPMEANYREEYKLPPLWAFQKEADEIRAKQGQQQAPPQTFVNPYSPPAGMADSLGSRSGDEGMPQAPARARSQDVSQPPVISHNGEIPTIVRGFLQTVPGGDHLMKLRKKHSSNSGNDQTMRMAIKVVINHLMTGDTSDPDLAEALATVKQAGVQLGQ